MPINDPDLFEEMLKEKDPNLDGFSICYSKVWIQQIKNPIQLLPELDSDEDILDESRNSGSN